MASLRNHPSEIRNSMKAMILAAGLGTRLRPFSLVRPKPLFPILDKPLLIRIIDQLRVNGIDEILVNCYHLRDQIVNLLDHQPGVSLQQENKILGTGGGLREAMVFFGKEPILIVNGDIFHTINLKKIIQEHKQSGNIASLILHDYPRFNNVSVTENGSITGFGDMGQTGRQLAFTGIHVIEPSLLNIIPQNSYANIIDCYLQWILQGTQISGLEVTGHYWTDMGTPEDYLDLHSVLLQEKRFGASTPFFQGEDVEMLDDVVFDDWVAIGSRSSIGKNVSLKRVVVWDGVKVPDGTQISNTILF